MSGDEYATKPNPQSVICQHVDDSGKVCGLPIELVPSHSTEDCEIEGEMWWHDAELVPDGVDPCDAYDANDDHEGVPPRMLCGQCFNPIVWLNGGWWHNAPAFSSAPTALSPFAAHLDADHEPRPVVHPDDAAAHSAQGSPS